MGGGPAGAIVGLVAARAGARVRIVDRAVFPRDKLCGDTVNPGALAILHRLGVGEEVERRGLRVAGMVVSGQRGAGDVQIEGRYPRGLHGRALLRRDLDLMLLRAAAAAGCDVEEGVAVRRAIVGEARAGPTVTGVIVSGQSGERAVHAPVVVAADGRRSTVAFGLGLARHPRRPRRWAVGAYYTGVGGGCQRSVSDTGVGDGCQTPVSDTGVGGGCQTPVSDTVLGEMHVRRNCYIGVAPLPDGLTNVCVVREFRHGDADSRELTGIIDRVVGSDPVLRDRFANATLAGPPVILGPLAVDAIGQPLDGLLTAGDASGFIDPMTGDGLRFAIRGAELAADAALQALEHGWTGVHDALTAARSRTFAGKWRFNRALRALVASPRAIAAAAAGARLAPALLRTVITRAGDCDVAA